MKLSFCARVFFVLLETGKQENWDHGRRVLWTLVSAGVERGYSCSAVGMEFWSLLALGDLTMCKCLAGFDGVCNILMMFFEQSLSMFVG